MVWKPSKRVCTSPGCAPLFEMYQSILPKQVSRWEQVQEDFLRAMWLFDQKFIAGTADQGDNQNGKGDFFTDLMVHLLRNCSGKELHGRGSVPGLVFRNHALDASYPAAGTVELLVETKVAGAPKTKRNPSQKNPLGRPGSADLDKRIKEASLKTIDLKAEWARREGKGGGAISDLTTWLRRSKPLSFLFMAIRVVDDQDLKRTVMFADAANQIMDAVGVVAYGPRGPNPGYQSRALPTQIELDRVLARACTALRNLP